MVAIIKFACGQGHYPVLPVDTINGAVYWYGFTVTDFMKNTDLIFEGRILSDSVYFQRIPGDVRTYHTVLVLKQFKGAFKSDTIRVVTYGGKMIMNGQSEGSPGAYASVGQEAVIFASVMKLGNKDPDLYYVLYGNEAGFKTVCDKKDVVKEVYEPIEEVIGQKYVEVHANNCNSQQR